MNRIVFSSCREKPEEPTRTMVSERKNIYDYDEFDVFHRSDIDASKVKFGKRLL